MASLIFLGSCILHDKKILLNRDLKTNIHSLRQRVVLEMAKFFNGDEGRRGCYMGPTLSFSLGVKIVVSK